MPGWLTTDAVAGYLDRPDLIGLDPPDDNLALSTAAIEAAVERRRSDVDFTVTPVDADLYAGAVLWAALMFQARNAPSGFSDFGDDAAMAESSLGTRRREIMRLIGMRRAATA